MANGKAVASRYITIDEICENLRVSRGSVIRLLEDGLPYFRLRRQIRVDEADFKEFVRKRTVGRSSASAMEKRRPGRPRSVRQ